MPNLGGGEQPLHSAIEKASSEDLNSELLQKKAELEKEEKEKETLEKKGNEELFLWVIAAIVLFDVAAFWFLDTWSGPIIIGILELIALIVLASRWRVNEIDVLVNKILYAMPGHKDSSK